MLLRPGLDRAPEVRRRDGGLEKSRNLLDDAKLVGPTWTMDKPFGLTELLKRVSEVLDGAERREDTA